MKQCSVVDMLVKYFAELITGGGGGVTESLSLTACFSSVYA